MCAARSSHQSVESGLGALLVGESEGALLSTKAWVFGHSTFACSTVERLPSHDAGRCCCQCRRDAWSAALLVGELLPSVAISNSTEKFDPAVSAIKTMWTLPATEIGDIGKPGNVSASVGRNPRQRVPGRGGSTDPAMETPSGQAVLVKRFPSDSADMLARVGVATVPPPQDRSTALVVPRYRHSMTLLRRPRWCLADCRCRMSLPKARRGAVVFSRAKCPSADVCVG